MKRYSLAVVAVFVMWAVLDFVIHGVILQPVYAATKELWRPMAEMKLGLMNAVTGLTALFFVTSYRFLISPKSVGRGLSFGLLFGLGTGLSMGYGSYAVMPIPGTMAFTWFAGTVVEATLAGLLVGSIVR